MATVDSSDTQLDRSVCRTLQMSKFKNKTMKLIKKIAKLNFVGESHHVKHFKIKIDEPLVEQLLRNSHQLRRSRLDTRTYVQEKPSFDREEHESDRAK